MLRVGGVLRADPAAREGLHRLADDAREHLATRSIAFEVVRAPSPVMRTIRKAGIPVRLTSTDELTAD